MKLLTYLCTSLLLLPILAQADITIGVAGPHSGAYAAFGDQLWQGAKFAAADINARGGINGEKIRLIKADDACEPKQAVAIAHKLVDHDEVTAVLGHFCSSSTIPASEIYAEADVLMITPASTNPEVTDRQLPNIFRTCGRDDQQGIVAAHFIHDQLAAKKVAVIHDKDTYGQGLADATRDTLESLNTEVVLYEGLTRGEKDFNALITKIKQLKVDAVYFGGLHPEAGPLLRQMREQGLSMPLISGDGIVSKDFIIAAGGNHMLQNVYMTFGRDPRNIAEGRKVVQAFRKQNYEPEGYTLYSYATLEIIAQALQHNNKVSGSKLGSWLRSQKLNTVMGPKSWDTKGDLATSDYVIYKWQTDGTYVEVTDE